jgi:hypothetical protein
MTESNRFDICATDQAHDHNPETGGPGRCFGLCAGTGKRVRSSPRVQVLESLIKPPWI